PGRMLRQGVGQEALPVQGQEAGEGLPGAAQRPRQELRHRPLFFTDLRRRRQEEEEAGQGSHRLHRPLLGGRSAQELLHHGGRSRWCSCVFRWTCYTDALRLFSWIRERFRGNSTIDLLDTEVRELYAALDNQKRLLKEAARERRKLRAELACAREKSSEDECAGCISHMNDLAALRAKHDENVANLDVAKTLLANVSHELAKTKHELELVKDAPIVSDVLECDECPIFKSDLALLQSKFATVVCELEEVKSRPVLLGACKLCPTLRSKLDEKNALVKSLGKTKVVESSPPIDCHVCPSLISGLDNLAVEIANLENENTYLRVILSWVSASEPQLGMMIKQFKRGDGFGVGYTYIKSDFDKLYGKIGKAAGNTASTSTQPSLVDPTDGVLKEPPKAPP